MDISGPGSEMAEWLDGTRPIAPHKALDGFDALDPIKPGDVVGPWRGQSLPTGHPMDGLLEMLGWYGKIVEPSGRSHPLLFRRPSGAVVALEPAVMPTQVALAWPSLVRHSVTRMAFLAISPVLQARSSSARIEIRTFRGRHSAALVYDRQPIVDHLRRLDGSRVLGLMTRPGMRQPFLFLLTRETDRVLFRGPAFRSA